MLGTVVLVLCAGAVLVAAGIVFVLVGPLPTLPGRRLGALSAVPVAPAPAIPVAAQAVVPAFDPALAQFFAPSPTPPAPVATPVMPPPAPAPVIAAPAVPPPTPTKARRPAPPMPPLRRPRTAPSPLPRTRSARGTEPRPRQDFVEVEHTAPHAPSFESDDVTFVED